MAVNLVAPEALTAIPGVRLGTAEAAVKKPGRPDVALLAFDPGTTLAAVYTRNAFAAAPVQLARTRSAGGTARALLINSGNANAGTGAAGLADATELCGYVARALDVEEAGVLPFSTGVIGERLPVDRLTKAIPEAVDALHEDGWLAAARAIMTTDTLPKGVSRQIRLASGTTVNITGIAKGSGMIRPDMATMLAFVGTDATVRPEDLRGLLDDAAAGSFNRISVDGDTSTNDACVLFATGRGEALAPGDPDWPGFAAAVTEVCRTLAQAIVRDGEGATRFVTVAVSGARDDEEARRTAFTVAESPLVKTACFAGDPNWGRILAAVGRAGLSDFDIGRVSVRLDQVVIVRDGQPAADYREADAAAVMAAPEFVIGIELGRGSAGTDVWTCDLSYDYVRINAEYRS
ncbi:bifunctional glutamate N-acetyltransferase/amino-acid acetyltransferase ArgJ [Salinisphaera sp. P385]|uniref:Arginine biosynthesis bifunctional protein ArgJ n=1 Tax=Spectribacter acetivorans TaxID=3075603 RepID=A0ABU3B6J9_9GAMM|nr:bifunctional glutamate N-acetyltransferase/amino-acid acetyltransferase ArgJ [Salinisphaera sp. P385]MDT0618069.1 bifunctional glutamate N-acetyltransferase/amino-acid acetyltransferase ArgJ [Salinisphaera sp. P385]